ncbi:MAG: hypothetical protein Q8O43_01215 [Dehalococcoidia bacterium]|nr:hypothetical protein [Dehalococcoidia bacterium]
MNKKSFVLGLVIILVITLLAGCTSTSKSANTGKYEIVRGAVLGGKWQMYQMRIHLESGAAFDIDLLDLVTNDKVDGYFYPERGSGASLEIKAGVNIIYKADPAGIPAGSTLSDRFSFTANQPLGTAYVLNFRNSGSEKTVTILMEIIYPVTAAIRGPLAIK